MIYIYEGCDGSGKSTKAQEDAKRMNCKYIHNPVDWTSKTAYEEWLKFFDDHKNETICVDRSFLGNPIYRTWAGKPIEYTDEQLTNLLKQKFILVYCETGSEYEDATRRGEDNLKSISDYDKIKELYHHWINKVAQYNDVYIYNWKTKESSYYKSEKMKSLL